MSLENRVSLTNTIPERLLKGDEGVYTTLYTNVQAMDLTKKKSTVNVDISKESELEIAPKRKSTVNVVCRPYRVEIAWFQLHS